MHRCTHAKFLSFNVQPHKTHVRRCWPQGKRLSLCEAPGSSQFRGKEMMESSTTWWWLQFYKWQVNNHIIHVDFKPPSNIDSNLLYFQGYISKWCFHVKVMGRLGPWLPLWHLWPSLHTSHRCQQEGTVGATRNKTIAVDLHTQQQQQQEKKHMIIQYVCYILQKKNSSSPFWKFSKNGEQTGLASRCRRLDVKSLNSTPPEDQHGNQSKSWFKRKGGNFLFQWT